MNAIKILSTFSIESDNDTLSPIHDMLDIIPNELTNNFFICHNIRLLREKNKNKILWLVKYKKNVEKCYNTIFHNITFGFNIYYRDVKIFNFFNIKNNVVYFFKNEYNNNLLHKNVFVSDDDTITTEQYKHKLLGIIELYMDKISTDFIDKEYIIKFKHK